MKYIFFQNKWLSYIIYIKGHYTTLDNILIDDVHSPGMRDLELCLSHDAMLNICDSKGSDDLVVYKGNQEKIIQWLTKKVCTNCTHFLLQDPGLIKDKYFPVN